MCQPNQRATLPDVTENKSGAPIPLRCFFGHHRSASTWIHGIVRAVCRDLGWTARIVHEAGSFAHDLPQFLRDWPTDFLIYTNADAAHVAGLENLRGFHVVRDPRDIVVSSYFAHLYSHPTDGWGGLAEHREQLRQLSEADGLMREIVDCRRAQFEQMAAWELGRPDVLELRMEEMIRDPYGSFLAVFDFLDMLDSTPSTRRRLLMAVAGAFNRRAARRVEIEREWLRPTEVARHPGRRLSRIGVARVREIVHEHRFEEKTQGRAAGNEDVSSHWRKGMAGDWRNHFRQSHVEAFKSAYNPLLVKLGYESGPDW